MTERNFAWAILLALVLLGCAGSPSQQTIGADNTYSLILLRHAEKRRGPDPGLTRPGQDRAAFIAQWWGAPARDVRAVWSSDFRRTRETAEPLAEGLGVEVQVYNAADLEALAARLVEDAVTAVVIGHSNTTPRLAALLCECEIPPMDEADYETGYNVVVSRGHHAWGVLNLKKLWTDRPPLAE